MNKLLQTVLILLLLVNTVHAQNKTNTSKKITKQSLLCDSIKKTKDGIKVLHAPPKIKIKKGGDGKVLNNNVSKQEGSIADLNNANETSDTVSSNTKKQKGGDGKILNNSISKLEGSIADLSNGSARNLSAQDSLKIKTQKGGDGKVLNNKVSKLEGSIADLKHDTDRKISAQDSLKVKTQKSCDGKVLNNNISKYEGSITDLNNEIDGNLLNLNSPKIKTQKGGDGKILNSKVSKLEGFCKDLDNRITSELPKLSKSTFQDGVITGNNLEITKDKKPHIKTSTISYSIYSAGTSDVVDNDGDGYSRYRKLNLDIDVSSGTHTIYTKVYYKSTSSSSYSSYFTSSDFDITDNDSSDAIWIAMGSPNTELSHGSYDFRVDVYDASNDQKVASVDASSDSDLAGELFETASQDGATSTVSFNIYSANMSDIEDMDGDGYSSYRKLNIDVDVSSGTHTIYIKAYYKLSSSSSYSSYFTSSDFNITDDSSDDAYWFSVGSPNPELSHGSYDFRLDIYDASNEQKVASIDASSNSDLAGELFETISQDDETNTHSYSIYSADMSDVEDTDGDGYSRYRKLNLDVDVSSGTHTIYAKVYYKLESSSSYSFYFTSSDFEITDNSSNDAFWIAIGSPNPELSHGSYDFKVDVYDDSNDQKVASVDASSDSDLAGELFETASQDGETSSVTYSIYSAGMSDVEDVDGDGYSRYRKLNMDVDVSSGTHTMYAKVYYKLESSSSYSLYFTSNNFDITDNASDDAYWISIGSPNPELSHGSYDFKIDIFKSDNDQKVASVDADSDSDLAGELFETASQDGENTLSYTIHSASMSDVEDNDGDGYSSYRKLNLDVDASSGTHTIYAKVYYKLESSSSYSFYFTSSDFEITDNASDDAFWIAMGDPNPELSHGSYDFKVDIYDASNDQKVASVDADSDADLAGELFETDSQDDATSAVTYNIYSADMSDVEDNDGDGYSRYRKLNMDVDASSGTHTMYAKVYYKLESSSSYSLYFSSNNFEITDNASGDAYWISIGSPNPELSHGSYDFKIEIFTSDNDQKVASIDAGSDSDLAGELFETASQDGASTLNYTIHSANMSDVEDIDGDGYSSYRKLNLDVDASSGTHTIYAKVYYKLESSSSYSFYYTSSDFEITDNASDDAFWIAMGAPNPELSHGSYDFKVDIYDDSNDQKVASVDADSDADLAGELFETDAQDGATNTYTYTIHSASMSDVEDNDGDGYSSYRKLNMDVDVSSGTHTMYAKVYYKLESSSSYSLYFTSNNFEITDNASGDAYWISIGSPNPELSHGSYDFKIEIFKSDNDQKVASLDASSDSDLAGELFETASQDEATSSVTYTIHSANMSDVEDIDGDGYSSYRKLNLDVDASSGTHTIYAKVYYKLESSSTYSFYYTSSDFEITDNASDDAFWIAMGAPNPELSHGSYDFMVDIYDASNDQLVAIVDADSDADLAGELFETDEQDAATSTLSYTIHSANMSDVEDNDGDGYSSYRKLNMDVDVSSGTHTVYAKVYYKLESSGSYNLYFTSNNFEITDNASGDAYWISIGSPNTELSHGSYDFKIEIYDDSNDQKVASLAAGSDSDLAEELFETASQDEATSSVTFTIHSANMSDVEDIDGDGYSSYRKLNLDVDASSGTHTIYAKVYYKLESASTYSFYYTSNNFEITNNASDDAFWIAMGAPNPELSHDSYDFKVEIYETSNDQKVAGVDASSNSDLAAELFETDSEDGASSTLSYTIHSANTSDVEDIDGDGYSRYRKLNMDVDVSSGTHTIYAKVYYKLESSGSYSFYYTSSNFEITDNASDDAFWIALGSPNPELSHGSYDFKIEIYDASNDQMVTGVDASSNSDLAGELFETASEDASTNTNSFSIYSANMSDVEDHDGDAYSRYRKLNLDVDVNTGTHTIYAKVYCKLESESTYSSYFTSGNFDITESSSDDAFWIAIGSPNPELSQGSYDFMIEIYNASNDQKVADVDAGSDPDLAGELFETASEDEVVTGIEDVNNIDLQVYPNPVIDIVNVKLNNCTGEDIAMRILNSNGQIVNLQEKKKVFGSYQISTNVSNLSSGIYILILQKGDEMVKRKIVKL